MFKGLLIRRLNLPLFKVNDWLKSNRTPEHEKSHDFRYTLNNVAHEMYNDTVVPGDWNATVLQIFLHTG